MPTYQFEAMDAAGQEIRDEIDAANEEEAQTTIRQMGYFVTKISVKKQAAGKTTAKKKRGFSLGGAKTKHICAFTRQLSILQDAGLPILRSLKILENNQKPGKLKFALMDVCDEIEGGATLSEAMGKSPKVFSRLYVNMIKAGEAGGALETILQRLADFLERAESLKRKVKGALIYPIIVSMVAILILTGIMIFIVPTFEKMFDEFELKLPTPTVLLIAMSNYVADYWFLLIAMPILLLMVVKLVKKFRHGRNGFDAFIIRIPIFGKLIEKTFWLAPRGRSVRWYRAVFRSWKRLTLPKRHRATRCSKGCTPRSTRRFVRVRSSASRCESTACSGFIRWRRSSLPCLEPSLV